MTKKLTRLTALVLAVVMAFSVLLVPVSAASFNDVSDSAWYKAAVDYVYERGWMAGVSGTSFAPNAEVTRGMMVTVLARVAEAETDNETVAFSDTASGKWYTGAAAWAAQNGIVAGVGNGLFAPNRAITRQDLCTMLYAYIQAEDIKLENTIDRTFSDMDSVSDYAREAVIYCTGTGLVTGFEDSSFRPKDTATRAQVAQLMMRLDLLIKEGAAPTDPMPAQSFDGEAGEDMTVSVNAPEGALPEDTNMSVSRVTDEAALSAIAAKVSGELLAAADITFTKDGSELEPASDVEVQISLDGLENVANPKVAHVKADGSVEIVSAELVTVNRGNEKALRFYAKDFSIYAVFDGEADEYARLTVQFWNPIFAANGSYRLEPGYSVYVTRHDINNTDSEDGTAYNWIPTVVADPGIKQPTGNLVFSGWTFNSEYTDLDVDGQHTIEYIREGIYDYLADASNVIKDGETVLNVYPMIFYFYTVTYVDEVGDTAQQIKGYYSRTAETDVPVSCAYEPYNSEYTHIGWTRTDTGVNYKKEDTMRISGSVVLRARVATGFWINFEENPGEKNTYKGATYVPPVFCPEGVIPADAEPNSADMELSGYTFDGWYEGFTEGTGSNPDTWTNKFTFTAGATITRDVNLNAKWIANPRAEYTVIIWKQSINDLKTYTDAQKTYDYVYSFSTETDTGKAVSTIDLSAYTGFAGNPSVTLGGTEHSFVGFKRNTTKGDNGIVSTDTTVKPNNSTTINIYYDRELVTFNFYTPVRTNSTGTPSQNDGNYYYAQDTSNNNRYELVEYWNDNYYVGTTQISSSQLSTTLYNNSSYQVYCIYPQAGSSSSYSLYYDSGWKFKISGTTYSYSTTSYPNARIFRIYRTSATTFYRAAFTTLYDSMDGLYGQDIDKYGDAWPGSTYWWYEDSGSSTPGDTRTTILTAFLPAGDHMTINFYGIEKTGSGHIYWYKQTVDGGWELADDVTTGAGKFNLSDKYTGFKVKEYSTTTNTDSAMQAVGALMLYNGNYYYDADPSTEDTYDGIPSGYTNLYIRNERLKYPISYYVGSFFDGNLNPDTEYEYTGSRLLKSVPDILYGADLSDYAKGHSAYYDPVAAGDFTDPAWVFVGWYTTPTCANGSEYTFSKQTLPLNGLQLYAKFVKLQYRVFLIDNAPTGITVQYPENQDPDFRRDYQDVISNGQRIELTDPSGNYVLVGWYRYTDATHTKMEPYNFATQVTDAIAEPYPDSEKLTSDLDRPWITKKVVLYAKWRRVLDGSNGIHVRYDADYIPSNAVYHGEFEDHTTVWEDGQVYADGATVIARSASKPLEDGFEFRYWEILDKDGNGTGQYVYPGGEFTLNVDDASSHEVDDHEHVLELVEAVAPTCDDTGLRAHYRCTVCGRLFTDAAGQNETTQAAVTIDALGHLWGEPTYTWTETADGWTCHASAVCSRDESHVLEEDGDMSYAVVTPVQNGQDGLGRYTATFTNEPFETQTKDVVITAGATYTVTYLVSYGTAPSPDVVTGGTTITLPTASAPTGYTFLGWVDEEVDETAEAPSYRTDLYTVNSNKTFRALYKHVVEGDTVYELVTDTLSDWSGNYVITHGKTTTLYALKGAATSSNTSMESSTYASSYANTGMTLDGNLLRNVPSTYVFTMASLGSSQYSIKSASANFYVGSTSGGTLTAYTSYSSSYCKWTISIDGDVDLYNDSYSNYPYLCFNGSNKFWMNGQDYDSMYLWRETTEKTNYYTTEIATYTVSYSVPTGATAPTSQTVLPHETVTLPAAPSGVSSTYTFLGWVAASVEPTTTQPTFYAAGATSPEIEADTVFYALYSYQESSGTTTYYQLVTSSLSDWTGNYVITYGTDTSMYVMKGVTGSSSGTSIERSANRATYAASGITLTDDRLTDVANTYVFAMEKTGSYYTAMNVSTRSYLGLLSSNTYLASYSTYNSTYCRWSLGVGTNASGMRNSYTSGDYSYLGFSTSSNYFWAASGVNTSVRLWKETTGSIQTTYYTTELAAEHTHQPQLTAAQNATCTEAGNTAYYTCSVCGKLFTDAACTNETTLAAVTVAALGHDVNGVAWSYDGASGHWQVCRRCSEHVNSATHTMVEDTSAYVAPTASGDGSRTERCSVCGYETVTAVPGWTVTYSVPSGITVPAQQTVEQGESLTLAAEPAATPSGYHFEGWVTAALPNATTTQQTGLTGSYTPTANVTLYALYTYTEGSGGSYYQLLTSAPSDWAGNYVITSGTSLSDYAMKGLSNSTSYETSSNGGQQQMSSISGLSLSGNRLTNVPALYVFTLTASGSYYTIKNNSANTYLGGTGTLYAYTSASSAATWDMSVSGTTVKALNTGSSSNYRLQWYSSTFQLRTTGTDVKFWKETQDGATYYTTDITSTSSTYTVTFSVPSGVTAPAAQTVASGGTADLTVAPSGNLTGWTFAGWTDTPITGETTSATPLSSCTVTGNTTLYALYRRTAVSEAVYTLVQSASAIGAGTYVITCGKDSSFYALRGIASGLNYEDAAVVGSVPYANSGMVLSSSTTLTNVSDAFAFNLAVKNTSYYSIQNVGNSAYVARYAAADGIHLASMAYSDDYCRWSLSYQSTNGNVLMQHYWTSSSFTSYQYLDCATDRFWVNTDSGDNVNNLYLWKQTTPASSTDYYATAAAPRSSYTVTFSVPNTVSSVSSASVPQGESVTMPEAEAPTGYGFIGWATGTVSEQSAIPACYAPGAKVTPNGNLNLVAVYAKYSYDLLTSAPSSFNAKYVVITSGTTGTSYMLKCDSTSGTSLQDTSHAARINSVATLSGSTISGVPDDYVFYIDLSNYSTSYKSLMGTSGNFLSYYSSALRVYATDTSEDEAWTVTYNSLKNGEDYYVAFNSTNNYFYGTKTASTVRLWIQSVRYLTLSTVGGSAVTEPMEQIGQTEAAAMPAKCEPTEISRAPAAQQDKPVMQEAKPIEIGPETEIKPFEGRPAPELTETEPETAGVNAVDPTDPVAATTGTWVETDEIATNVNYLIGIKYGANVYLIMNYNPTQRKYYYTSTSGSNTYYYGYVTEATVDSNGTITGVSGQTTDFNYCTWKFGSTTGGVITSVNNTSYKLYSGAGAFPYTDSYTWVWDASKHTLEDREYDSTTPWYTTLYPDTDNGGFYALTYMDDTLPTETSIGLYRAATATVTFNANGGEGTMAAQPVAPGSTLNANAFTRSGYSFVGWNTAANGTGTAYADGAAVSFSSNTTLYAQWRQEPAAGEDVVYRLVDSIQAGEDYVIVKDGYAVKNANPSGATIRLDRVAVTVDSTNNTVTVPAASVEAVLWHAAGYTSSGSFYGSFYNLAVNKFMGLDSSYTLNMTDSSLAWKYNGTDLDNQCTDSGNESYYYLTIRTSSPLVFSTSKSSGQNIKFYKRVIESANRTVTFHANNGTNTTATQTVPYNEATALNENTFTYANHEFLGWTTNADGTGTFYADEATVTLTANIDLYAKWVETVTITFNGNGATGGSMEPQTVRVSTATALTANAFTKSGSTFQGWNTMADGSGEDYVNEQIVSLTANLTLYAQWEEEIWYPAKTVVAGEEFLIGYKDGSGNVVLLMNYNPNNLQEHSVNSYEHHSYLSNTGDTYAYGIAAEVDASGNVIGVSNAAYANASLDNAVWVFEKNGDYLRVRSGFEGDHYLRVASNPRIYSDVLPATDYLSSSNNWSWNAEAKALTYTAGSLTRYLTYVPGVDTRSVTNLFNAPIGASGSGYSELQLYSKTAATFDVTFVDGITNEPFDKQDVFVHQDAELPTPPLHSGYLFDHWEGDYTDVDSDRTVTAVYVAHADFTVTFVDESGTVITTKNVHASDFVNAEGVETPTKEGFVFKEWQLNGLRFYFETTPITSNITLTPAFTKAETVSYTITLRAVYGPKRGFTTTHVTWYADNGYTDANGDYHDGYNEDSETVLLNNKIPIKDPTGDENFYNPGYKFIGWARLNEPADSISAGHTYVVPDGCDYVNEYTDLTEDDLWLKYFPADADHTTPYFKVNISYGTALEPVWRETKYIAANENYPYHGLYAVWQARNTFYVLHSATGKLEAYDIPISGASGGSMISTFPLSSLVTDGCLYGGYYKDFGGIDTEALEAKITSSEIGMFDYNLTGWTAAPAVSFNGTTFNKHVYETASDETLSFVSYDGSSVTNGRERFWTRSKAYTAAKGDDPGNALHAKAGVVYYLKEVPDTYLTTKYIYTYDASDPENPQGEIQDFFMLTVMDDNLYKNVGFRRNAETPTVEGVQNEEMIARDAFAGSFTIVQKGHGTEGSENYMAPVSTTITAANFGLTSGFIAVKVDHSIVPDSDPQEENPDSYIKANNTFALMPAWETLDGVEVNSHGTLKIKVNSEKTKITYELLGDVLASNKLFISVANVASWWYNDSAVTKLYFFNAKTNTWVTPTAIEGKDNLYECELPPETNGSWTHVIVTRSTSSSDWSNQTVNIPLGRSWNQITVEGQIWEEGNPDYGKCAYSVSAYNP